MNAIDEQAKQYVSARYMGGSMSLGKLPSGKEVLIPNSLKDAIKKRIAEGIPAGVSRDVWRLQQTAGAFDASKKIASMERQGLVVSAAEKQLIAEAAKLTPLEELTFDNSAVAYWLAAEMPKEAFYGAEGGKTGLVEVLGLKTDISEKEARRAVAEYFALMATQRRESLRDRLVAEGFTVPAEVKGSAGLFDDIGRKAAGAWENVETKARGVQTALGRALSSLGGSILRLEDKVPWLSQYFVKPLGFHIQAVALDELGRVLVDGSISTFNEKRFSRASASTFRTAGQALIVMGAWLPQPWGVAAAALGTLSVVVGRTIDGALDQAEYKKLQKSGALDVTRRFDDAGREVDVNGVPLDPIQRAAWAREQEALASQAESGAAAGGELKDGGDGYFYGPWQYPSGKVFYTAFQAVYVGKQPTKYVPRFGWDGSQWRRVAG